MNFFRRLDAALSGELLAAQVATTSRTAETADATPMMPVTPTGDDHTVFAALGALAANPGVLTDDTPGLPAPANPMGQP